MFRSKKAKAANLFETGTKAVGTITSVQDTGMTVNDNPRVKMTFRVEPLDGAAPFEAEKTSTVPRVAIPQAGQRYPIWFDPESREFAYATVDGGDEGRRQIVALFGEAFGADGSGVGRAAPVDAAPAPGADPLERIAKLDELRRSGALTDEEFAAQKQKLLADL